MLTSSGKPTCTAQNLMSVNYTFWCLHNGSCQYMCAQLQQRAFAAPPGELGHTQAREVCAPKQPTSVGPLLRCQKLRSPFRTLNLEQFMGCTTT